jgi:acyl-CoA thioesterase
MACQVSYQLNEESSLVHQWEMPDVPGPETLKNSAELYQGFLDRGLVPEGQRQLYETRLKDAEQVPYSLSLEWVSWSIIPTTFPHFPFAFVHA